MLHGCFLLLNTSGRHIKMKSLVVYVKSIMIMQNISCAGTVQKKKKTSCVGRN